MKKVFQIIISIAGIAILVIDQIIKEYIVKNLPPEGIQLIKGILNIGFVKNTGASFGIGGNSTIMFIMVNLVILGFIIKFMLFQKESIDKKTFVCLIMILIGGVSNVIDRVCRGYVVDYIDINEIIKFPLFNIADMCISIGCILLLIILIASNFKERGHTS